eukprot:14282064-Heterocapsa_arctica.AAC.1
MKPPPANYTRQIAQTYQMKAGALHTILAGLTTYGGIAERSADSRVLAVSNSCKSDTESTSNLNVSGMPE